MAVLTAQGIARVAIPLLSRKLSIGRTVTMVSADGFAPPNGETITVRVRQPRSARTQASAGAAITYDDQTEIPVDVSLGHIYDAYHVTDEDLTYSIEDFAYQITEPQVESVAVGAEQTLYTVMNALSADDSFALSASDADTENLLQTARETLSSNNVPNQDRWLAVSPDIYTRLLDVDNFVRADALGGGESSALRDAMVGRILGFNVLEAVGLTAGTAVAYHRSGFVMANKLPGMPRGANETGTYNAEGLTLRQIFQYDPDVLSDASVLSTFAGSSAVFEDGTGTNGTNNDRFFKIDTATA